MNTVKADIIAQLRKEIISVQTHHATPGNYKDECGLATINNAFPNKVFPKAAVHEFISCSPGDVAATIGFISGIIASLMKNKSAAIWISNNKIIFPPALKNFGITPDKIIFIYLKKEKEILWAMEEALKCEALAAVIADIPNLNFTASRRLQLAVEKSNVTGFILRQTKNIISPTACVSRWKITSLPTALSNNMPGVGFPRWNVELIKIRNGKPGKWQVEWIRKNLNHITESPVVVVEQKKEAV